MQPLNIAEVMMMRAFLAAPTEPVMPPNSEWYELAWREGGALGLTALLFVVMAVSVARWAAPRIDRRLDLDNKLREQTIDNMRDIRAWRDRMERHLEMLVRCYEQIAGMILRNCGKTEPPPSDTTIKTIKKHKSGSGDAEGGV